MRSLLKTALVCCSLFSMARICLADDSPQQANTADLKPETLRVLVTDCIDKTPVSDSETRQVATAAVWTAVDRFGMSPRNRFDRISRQEVWTAAERLGMPVPEHTAPSGRWTEEERFQLGKALHADLVCDAEVTKTVDRKSAKLRAVVVSIYFRDITFRIPRTGGIGTASEKTLYAATKSCAEWTVRSSMRRLIPAAHVLSRTDQSVDVDLGVRGGVKVGDDWVIVREIAGKKVQIGTIRIQHCYPTDAEGIIVTASMGIQTGDIALPVYTPRCEGLL